jgi:hypothetical protein
VLHALSRATQTAAKSFLNIEGYIGITPSFIAFKGLYEGSLRRRQITGLHGVFG